MASGASGGLWPFPPAPAAWQDGCLWHEGHQHLSPRPENQTALVDKSRSTVTYYVTSQSNHTAVVLYDSRNGYVCYKPVEQHACYLRRMDHWDLQTLQTSLNTSEQRHLPGLETKYYREFMGILAGEQVDPKSLGEAVQALCEQTSIFWVRRGEGPGKQRLIYLCIDICFPSNICVSICFYYLPE
uniref:BRICHOS domain containing 5 n=1 Tax=Otus sunia TaxID=257818 RepID=A0A8C8BHN6_9STRI